MIFNVIGISHWKSEVSIREHFYLNTSRKASLDEIIGEISCGVMMLDTCNRTELYGFCTAGELVSLLCKATGTDISFFKKYGYVYTGDEAINHLFEVSLGLDSQILGDVQIIQQVKQAYNEASDRGLCSEFHQLIQSVFRAHKRSRTETEFGKGMASVGFAATQTALDFFPNLKKTSILLIGAGKMGKVSLKNLISNGAQHITIVNRTIQKAKHLANSFDIQALSMNSLDEEVKKADLIITATASEQPVIYKHHFEGVESKKLIIDLSIPRNVDARVDEIEAITLIDMDSINALTGEALKKKKELIPALHAIIDEEKMDYLNKLERSRRVQPRIREIDNKLTDITQGELDRIKNKLDPEAFEMLEEVTYRIKKKILAVHINRIDEEMHAEHQNA